MKIENVLITIGALCDAADDLCVLEEGIPLKKTPTDVLPSCHDWKTYYEWRKFSLASPIAVILSHILTMYHIVANLLSRDCEYARKITHS